MKFNKRRGFTLVELLIVIAIVAVLSAVAVVGYSSFKKKAYISNDEALVAQMNTILSGYEALDGRPDTPNEAFKVLAREGFKVVDLEAQVEGYEFIYNHASNQFVLINEDGVATCGDLDEIAYNNWRIVDSRDDVDIPKYGFSVYLDDEYQDTTEDLSIFANIGVDMGNYRGYKFVNYELADFDGELIVRTSHYDSNLMINTPNATIRHFGLANSVNVVAVADSSFHEFGVVGRFIIATGHAVLEDNAEIFCVMDIGYEDEYKDFATIDIVGKKVHSYVAEKGVTIIKTTTDNMCVPNAHSFHKLIVDAEYVYDVCEKCGYTVKCKKNAQNNYDFVAVDLSKEDVAGEDAAVGMVLSYTSANGETVIEGVSFFVGQGITVGSAVDLDDNVIMIDEENVDNGVISLGVDDFEALLIEYGPGRVGDIEVTYAGGVVDKDGNLVYPEKANEEAIKEIINSKIKKNVEKSYVVNNHTHNWTVGGSTATCTVDGVTVYKCECGLSYSEKTSALGHDFDDDIDGTDQCIRCGTNHFFAAGKGSKEDPWIIRNRTHMQGISHYYDSTLERFYEVADDVNTIDCTNWTPVHLNGHFNGNGVHFTNVTASLFRVLGHGAFNNHDFVLKDFEVTFNARTGKSDSVVRSMIDRNSTVTFKNVDVHGYEEGVWNLGSYINYGTCNDSEAVGSNYTVIFEDCKSDLTIACTNGSSIAGFVGHAYQGAEHTANIIIKNSEYTGKYYYTDSPNAKEYYAMNTSPVIVSNGSSVLSNDFIPSSRGTKITTSVWTKEADGYYVAKADGAARIKVTLTCQMTGYDTVTGEARTNLGGITMSLSDTYINNTSENKVKVLDLFSGVNGQKTTNSYDGEVINDTLCIYIAEPNDGYTYLLEGYAGAQINQYDSNGNLISCSSITLATREHGGEWIIQ